MVDGTAVFTPTVALGVGSHEVTATYGGDDSFDTSSDVATVQVSNTETATVLAPSANPSRFGQPVTFTATVSPLAPGAGMPTGEVDLQVDSSVFTATLQSGVATFTLDTLDVGPHAVTAVYQGDDRFNPSDSEALSQDVQKAGTTTALSTSLNPVIYSQPVVWTVTVSPVAPGAGTPGGVVSVTVGSSVITGTLSGGVATFPVSVLTVGTHGITASYGGDERFAASNGHLDQTVDPIQLSVCKSDGKDTQYAAWDYTYVLTVTNSSPVAAQGVVLSDMLPDSLYAVVLPTGAVEGPPKTFTRN